MQGKFDVIPQALMYVHEEEEEEYHYVSVFLQCTQTRVIKYSAVQVNRVKGCEPLTTFFWTAECNEGSIT